MANKGNKNSIYIANYGRSPATNPTQTVQNAMAKAAAAQSAQPATAQPATNPYMAVYGDIESRVNANAASQTAAAQKRYDDSVNALEQQDAAWRQGQSDLRDMYLKQLNERQERDTAKSNASYDANASQNYINYMRAQRQLPSQLAALGIRGGASESALIRLGANYGTNVANNNMARAQALDNIAQQYADTISEYETEYRRALLARDDAKATQLASMLDNLNSELSNITAEQNSALLNAYSTAAENDLAYKERQDEIKRQQERQAIEDERYEREWNRYENEKNIEAYSAGRAAFSIKELQRQRKKLTSKKGWSKDPVTYRKVQAIDAQIGALKNR